MKKEVFNSVQKVASVCLYTLIAQLSAEEKKGAVAVLATVLTLIEDGFVSLNADAQNQDFYVQCFDVLAGAALSLKTLEDDGLCPEDFPVLDKTEGLTRLAEARRAVERAETLLLAMVRPSETLQ